MGLAWLFRRRKRSAPAPVADPADELKRKLEESRAVDEPDPAPEPEPAPAPEAPLDERRDAVHQRARESIERMRGDTPAE